MIRRLVPSAVLRAIAMFMLAVVGLHALAPVGTPLERRAGSAFSAATSDVSLAGKRKAVAQARTIVEPDGGRSAGESLPVAHVALSAVPIAISVDLVRLPPPRILLPRTVTGPFGARGPPLA